MRPAAILLTALASTGCPPPPGGRADVDVSARAGADLAVTMRNGGGLPTTRLGFAAWRGRTPDADWAAGRGSACGADLDMAVAPGSAAPDALCPGGAGPRLFGYVAWSDASGRYRRFFMLEERDGRWASERAFNVERAGDLDGLLDPAP